MKRLGILVMGMVVMGNVSAAQNSTWDQAILALLDKGYEIKSSSMTPFAKTQTYIEHIILQKKSSWAWCVNELNYTLAKQNDAKFPDLESSGKWGCRVAKAGEEPSYSQDGN